MEERPNYYAIIPANVRYDTELKDKAKLLYGEISALSNKDGCCFATNKYFADLYGVSTTTISLLIKQLIEKGYIYSEIVYKEGTKEILNRYLTIIKDPYLKNLKYPIKENLKDNNTSINNTSNNKKEIYKERFKKPSLEEVSDYCKERNNGINPQTFIDFYESKGWLVGKSPMKDWKACIRTWERNRTEIKQDIVPSWFEKQNELDKMSTQDEEDLDTILEEMGY